MFYIAAIAVSLVLVLLLWIVPRLQAERIHQAITPLQRAQAANEFRRTIAQILGGLFILGGLYYTSRQLYTTQEGQITERFSRAIQQLGAVGSDDTPIIEVRQGGIYSLERIAQESPRDYWPIIEILSAYIRGHAPNPHPNPRPIPQISVDVTDGTVTLKVVLPETKLIRQDVQSALTVIARRNSQFDDPNRSLNLSKTDLHGSDLRNARLRKVIFRFSNLRSADLTNADLTGAILNHVDLQKAQLQGAILRGARLDYTLFTQSVLKRTDLRGVDLRTVRGLTKQQLNDALIDGSTKLPEDLAAKSPSK